MFGIDPTKKNFLAQLELFKESLKDKYILLFLDYDGTLAPIVGVPQEADAGEEMKQLLKGLSQTPHCQVAIVTGRALSDIKARVGLENIIYVANHGFEISGASVQLENTTFPTCRIIFDHIIAELQKHSSALPGLLIEDKGVTLSIHYRLVEKEKQAGVEKEILKVTHPYQKLKEISLRKGKKVCEIRPPTDWDKGKAVQWLLKEHRVALHNKTAIALYIGDDETDEDAFTALHDQAITIRVGRLRGSKAQYYLDNVDQVRELLAIIFSLKRG